MPGKILRITPDQLGQLRQTVMVLGELMIRSGESKRPWPAIYTDITIQFGFARSEDITQEIFPQVLAARQLYRSMAKVRRCFTGWPGRETQGRGVRKVVRG